MLEVIECLTAYTCYWDLSKDTGFDLGSLVGILDGRTDDNADSELYTHNMSLFV